MNTQDIDPEIAAALDGLPQDFAGFDQIYASKLRPELEAMEAGRELAAAKARKGYAIGGLIGGLGVLLALFVVGEPFLAILAGMAGLGVSSFMGKDLRQIGRQAKSMMVLPVAHEFGLEYEEAPGTLYSIQDFHGARLLPGWDRENFEDRMMGKRGEVDFEFFEAHLEKRQTTTDSQGRTRTRWVTVFRGQCLRFDFHKAFHGRTLVARDAGLFNRFGGDRDMKLAKLEDPVFEKSFSVYTTDQVESRYLLTPDFMQRLVDLEETFHGGRLRCAFVGGEVLIAVEGGDLFEPGSLFKPLDNPARIRELLNDFSTVFHLIDQICDTPRRA